MIHYLDGKIKAPERELFTLKLKTMLGKILVTHGPHVEPEPYVEYELHIKDDGRFFPWEEPQVKYKYLPVTQEDKEKALSLRDQEVTFVIQDEAIGGYHAKLV